MTKQTKKDKVLERIYSDNAVRTGVTRPNFYAFFHIYFTHYIKYKTAPFQKEIMKNLQSQEIKNLVIVSFRGSGKSTIVTTAFPIWSILGSLELKFILIVCQTKGQAKQHMMNLRSELESNRLLKKDLGPFREESDEWGSGSIVFKKYNSRITVVSTEQSVRGLRHNEYRPQLIICDDLEDLSSVKTSESRQKIYEWFLGDLVPVGDKDTKMVMVGNKLHEDSLLIRIRNKIQNEEMNGRYCEYPILDLNEKCIWLEKFPDEQSIQELKNKTGSEVAWQREYLLNIVSNEDQLIKNEWIKYYDYELIKDLKGYTATGIDFAISQKEHADYTAIVTAKVIGRNENLQVYILPNIVNKRMTSEEISQQVKLVSSTSQNSKIYLEDNGFQRIFIDIFKKHYLKAEGVTSVTDKFSRLSAVSLLLESGKVFFPRTGAKELIQQLVGFGREKHDDLADAFSLLLGQVLINDRRNRASPAPKIDRMEGGKYFGPIGRNFSEQKYTPPPRKSLGPWLGVDVIGF